MKYMGSKRWMLRNGLGYTLDDASAKATRFIDLFAGSGVVATYIGTRRRIPVLACDLQKFSIVLTKAIIGRDEELKSALIWKNWFARAARLAACHTPPVATVVSKTHVNECRKWCESKMLMVVTKAYGGHYYSPEQAIWIDALRSTVPKREPARTVALAALIQAASQCAAAPGHTAQPFQPTRTAKKFLKEAWSRNVVEKTRFALDKISNQHALIRGDAKISGAIEATANLTEGDLVFVDPPYTSVQYSRFYHVLETIARGECGKVEGVGRYPALEKRPQSRFSIKSECSAAFDELMTKIAERKASVVVTFPDHLCSNGLSGDMVRHIAQKYFYMKELLVDNKFSTLGGNDRKSKTGNVRAARLTTRELILHLTPKR